MEKENGVEVIKLESQDEFKHEKSKDREIAGFFGQLRILLWKNILLAKRNKSGSLTEILCPTAFLLILLIIRYLVDNILSADQTQVTINAIDPLKSYNFTTTSNTTTDTLLFYPNNTLIESIINRAVVLIKSRNIPFNQTVRASSLSDGTKLNLSQINSLTALFTFPQTYTSILPDNVEYSIYTQEQNRFTYKITSTFLNKVDYMFSRAPEAFCFDNANSFVLYRKFNALKVAVDLAIAEILTNKTLTADSLHLSQFPCQAYNRDEVKARFSFFFSIIIAITFIFTLLVNIGNIVVEKETKMKEYLKLVGIRWYTIWLTWFIRSISIYTVLSLLFSVICVIPMPIKSGQNSTIYQRKTIFNSTNFFVVFSTLFVYSLQVSSFILLISQIFSKPFIAKVITILIWLITAIDFYTSLASSVKYFMCIFPNAGFLFALQIIFQFERSSKSLGMSNLYSNIFDDELNLGGILATQITYSLIYLPIAWYIENILPGEYGVPLPFYYPFMPSYWIPQRRIKTFDSAVHVHTPKYGFERDPDSLRATVCIQNISKDFRTAFKVKRVVNNMSINFFENQITGFLGHNGAGKTTTTFMLCGIYPPTEGTANILGFDIVNEMDRVRSQIGFCPQYNILYDELTVEEHLELVAKTKGFPSGLMKSEVERISTFVGLHNDLKTQSKSLSGGMKRRLCVSMALIGDSKVIILDEPTSGLDPFNRRSLWELIRKYKNGHTIIMTTHFMEEADALSDRIAIVNHGEVKCVGSPLYLKNLFGSGYRLTVSKASNFNESELLMLVKEQVPQYRVESNIAGEISLSIPYTCNQILPQILTLIESQQETLGISSYGISSSTIEEVFLKVGQIDKNGDVAASEFDTRIDSSFDLTNIFQKEFIKKEKFALWFSQIKALFIKRFFIFFRRYLLAIMILGLPLLFEGLVTYLIPSQTNRINTISGIASTLGTFRLDMDNYSPQTLPYALNGSISTLTFQTMLRDYYAKRSRIQLEEVTSNVGAYVLSKRKENIKNLVLDYFGGFDFNLMNSTNIMITSFYSSFAYHTSASMLNEASNLLIAYHNSLNTSKSIRTFNVPIASDNSLYSGNDFFEIIACIDSFPLSLFNFLNSVLVALIISMMVMHVGRERVNGSKSLQFLTGTHFSIYWLSNYLFDFLIVLFNISSMVIILKIIDTIRNDPTSETNALASNESIGFFWLLLFFSSFTWLTLAYIWSFLFKSEIIGFVVLVIILAVTAFIDVIFSFFELNLATETSTTPLNMVKALRWILVLALPNLTVKRGSFYLKTRTNAFCISQLNKFLKDTYTENEPGLSMRPPGIGVLLVICVLQTFVGMAMLYLIEKRPKILCCLKKNDEINQKIGDTWIQDLKLENDVEAEFKRIYKSDLTKLAQSEPLVVNNLKMIFKKKKTDFVAVNNLGFGIKEKECFGLLGLNGAGKTTTFSILTGQLGATSGQAFINGYDVSKQQFNARNNLGFCPQFDQLPEYLTVKQSLILFGALRGLSIKINDKVVNDLMSIFKLNEFTSKLVQDLSGGNKRKVSAAIAFLGKPKVVILDEPTSGMDPGARRYLWQVINKARDLGITIVLTSHSMGECEALCDRLGIMVNGQFHCLGSVQHLKSKYGLGYSLIIKLNSIERKDILAAINFVQTKIENAKLKDEQQETLFYQIENQQSISSLFALIESNRSALKIETYSLSQTTLEEVFLSFARLQRNADDECDIEKKKK